MAKPPLLRYAIAATIVIVAFYAEFRPPTMVAHPFLLNAADIGDEIDIDDVEYRQVPPGLFPPVELPVALPSPLPAGAPLIGGDASPPLVPPGWRGIVLEIPDGVRGGARLGLIVTGSDHHAEIPAIVASQPTSDGFGGSTALVAVDGGHAAAVAEAATDRRLVVLVAG